MVLQTLVYTDRARVSIVDWEATGMQVRTSLLHAAIHSGNFPYLSTWSDGLSEDVRTLLQNRGFRYWQEPKGVKRSDSTILVRPVHHEILNADWVIAGQSLLDLSNWDLRMIYSDGY